MKIVIQLAFKNKLVISIQNKKGLINWSREHIGFFNNLSANMYKIIIVHADIEINDRQNRINVNKSYYKSMGFVRIVFRL